MFRALLFLNTSNKIDIPFLLNWKLTIASKQPQSKQYDAPFNDLVCNLESTCFFDVFKERKDRVIETPMIQINLE